MLSEAKRAAASKTTEEALKNCGRLSLVIELKSKAER